MPHSRSSSIDDTGRSKHIEVCVRLRPLSIRKNVSSSSFFHSSKNRKPGIPKFQSKLSSPKSSASSPTSTNATTATTNHSTTTDDSFYAWDVVEPDTVTQSHKTERITGRTHTYTLDRVYGPETATKSLYDQSVKDLVTAAMEGYHTAVLAYGQTSTGKTHTMTGTPSEPGLIPLSVRECFAYLQNTNEDREFLLRVSYLEVYKEHIKDLLSNTVEPIRLFEHAEKGLIIRNLKEEVVTSPEQVFQILASGEARRQVGATHLNQHSSRSHVMVRLWIESRPVRGGTTRVSSVSLVDLAGSESVRLTGSTERQSEGHYINKSLMTLGKVVYGLSDEKNGSATKKHIPYRDSKLTRLLQPSLSGNAQIVLVCCISPLASHMEESHNTFKFAVRAKKIPQKAVIDEDTGDNNMLQSYRDEIEDLKQQLRDAQQQLQHSTPQDTEEEMMELVVAIRNMEKLILKTKSGENGLMGDDLLGMETDDYETTPVSAVVTPPLQSELARIQGLLGAVLQKRVSHDETVRHLRAQLEEQEVTGTLRQADASFLQQQLAEKDALLGEVSKLLETVEEKQSMLEAENAALREELAMYTNGGDSRR